MSLNHITDSITSARVTELACELVGIRSVTGNEKALGDFLYDLFGQIGLSDIQRVPVADSGDSLVARIPGRADGPAIMFNFHQDTFDVCDGWETDPWDPMVRDGSVYGLGAHDMKGGGASILAAVEAITNSDAALGGTLLVSTTTDEENWSRGAHAVIDSGLIKGCSACLIPEPTPPGRLRIGSRGRHVIRVGLTGKTAHAAYTGEGINAVVDGAKIITALETLELGWNEQYDLGGAICVIEFGGGMNIILVPEHAHILIDRHILPGQTIEEAAQDIRDAIDVLNIESKVDITWDHRPTPAPTSYIVDESSAFVQSTKRRVEEQLGRPITYALARSVADTNHFAVHVGIPTLVYGPEGGNTCMANEFVDINSMVNVARAYCGVAADLLGMK